MQVIGIDLGGTKIAAGMVNASGKILGEMIAPSILDEGPAGLINQIKSICIELLKKYGKAKAVGIGSAGPLHAPTGKLLDPTNFGWGPAVVPLTQKLEKALKIPVHLENDAAAAALAENWKGKAGDDCVIVTLGTGVGVGVILEGKLLRGSRGLHPEIGHWLLRPQDATALCGCGNIGCAEALLSGAHFSQRALRTTGKNLPGKEWNARADQGDSQALALFQEYGEILSEFLQNLVVTFYPKKIILTGSFAQAAPHFLPTTQTQLRKLLGRRLDTQPVYPELRVSKLGNRAGVIGGAYIALHKNYFHQ